MICSREREEEYNSPSLPLVDIVRFDPIRYRHPSHGFKTRLLGRGFHTKECFVPLPNEGKISQSTLFRGPTSSLTHRPMSGSDIIYNNPSPPLVVIVLFGPLCIAISLTVLKRVY